MDISCSNPQELFCSQKDYREKFPAQLAGIPRRNTENIYIKYCRKETFSEQIPYENMQS